MQSSAAKYCTLQICFCLFCLLISSHSYGHNNTPQFVEIDLGSGPESTDQQFAFEVKETDFVRYVKDIRASCGCVKQITISPNDTIPIGVKPVITFRMSTLGHGGLLVNTVSLQVEGRNGVESTFFKISRQILPLLDVKRYIQLDDLPKDQNGKYILNFESKETIVLDANHASSLEPELIGGGGKYMLKLSSKDSDYGSKLETINLKVGSTEIPIIFARFPKNPYLLSSVINAGVVPIDAPLTIICPVNIPSNFKKAQIVSTDEYIKIVETRLIKENDLDAVQLTFKSTKLGLVSSRLQISFIDGDQSIDTTVSFLAIAEPRN